MSNNNIDFEFYKYKARDTLIKHLSSIDGNKIIIYEDKDVFDLVYYLLPLLEITAFGAINECYIDNFDEPLNGAIPIYLLRPKRKNTKKVFEAIRNTFYNKELKKQSRTFIDAVNDKLEGVKINGPNRIKTKYQILFLTQKPYNFERELQKHKIYNYVHFEELNINLVSLDNNILSMEMELRDCFDDLYFSKDYSTTCENIARAIDDIESRYGSFSSVHLHGDAAKKVFKNVTKKQVNKTESKFDHLILIDRKVDFITPFYVQVNYEGLIDSIFGIKYCKIHIENSPNNSAKTKNQNEKTTDNCVTLNKLSSKNQFYHNKLRYEEISKLAIDAGKNREERTIFKTYIDPVLDKKILRKEIQLTTEQMAEWSRGKVLDANEERVKHIHVFGKILSSNINYFIKFQSKILSDTFSKYDMRKIISGDLGEVKLGKKDFDQVLSFLILFYSKYKHSSKQKNKDFLSELEELFIKEYSPSQFLFDNLKRIGLYLKNENLKDMIRLQKLNDCFEKSNKQEQQFFKLFDQNYNPIMCQSISKILFTNRKNPEEVSDLEDIFPEEYEYIPRHLDPSIQISPSNKNKNVLIFFIGGCTYNEIATFNILEKTWGLKFYFVTTGFINAKSIIEVLSHKFSQNSNEDEFNLNETSSRFKFIKFNVKNKIRGFKKNVKSEFSFTANNLCIRNQSSVNSQTTGADINHDSPILKETSSSKSHLNKLKNQIRDKVGTVRDTIKNDEKNDQVLSPGTSGTSHNTKNSHFPRIFKKK